MLRIAPCKDAVIFMFNRDNFDEVSKEVVDYMKKESED